MPSLRKVPIRYYPIALNFLAFGVIFAARITKDAALFTSEGGAFMYPIALVISAVGVTLFANKFEQLLDKPGPEAAGLWCSLILAAFFAVSALVLGYLHDPNQNQAGVSYTLFGHGISNYAIAAMFINALADLGLFFLLNIIWIDAGEIISDRERDNTIPKVSAFGLLGAAVGAGALLLAQNGFDAPLHWNFAFLAIFCITFALLRAWVLHRAALSSNNDSAGLPEWMQAQALALPQDSSSGLLATLKWAWANPYVRLFSGITIINFALIAIFDQSLANAVVASGSNEDDFAWYMGLFTIGFGIAGCLFHIFAFPWLRRRLSVPQLNIWPAVLLLLGCLPYVFIFSDGISKVFGLSESFRAENLLFILVLVRIFGWTAEYMFNQSLIPFIYAAPPREEGERARIFIEGPLTATTNCVAGVVLFGLFLVLAGDSQQADRADDFISGLDILMTAGMVLAVLMVVFSRSLIASYKEQLRLKLLRAGDGSITRANSVAILTRGKLDSTGARATIDENAWRARLSLVLSNPQDFHNSHYRELSELASSNGYSTQFIQELENMALAAGNVDKVPLDLLSLLADHGPPGVISFDKIVRTRLNDLQNAVVSMTAAKGSKINEVQRRYWVELIEVSVSLKTGTYFEEQFASFTNNWADETIDFATLLPIHILGKMPLSNRNVVRCLALFLLSADSKVQDGVEIALRDLLLHNSWLRAELVQFSCQLDLVTVEKQWLLARTLALQTLVGQGFSEDEISGFNGEAWQGIAELLPKEGSNRIADHYHKALQLLEQLHAAAEQDMTTTTLLDGTCKLLTDGLRSYQNNWQDEDNRKLMAALLSVFDSLVQRQLQAVEQRDANTYKLYRDHPGFKQLAQLCYEIFSPEKLGVLDNAVTSSPLRQSWIIVNMGLLFAQFVDINFTSIQQTPKTISESISLAVSLADDDSQQALKNLGQIYALPAKQADRLQELLAVC